MDEPQVKAQLAADLERARARLARNIDALRRDLDVPTHLKRSFEGHKAAYIGGATFFGLLLSKLPSRKKKIYVAPKGKEAVKEVEKAGVWLILLQMLFKTFRPAIASFIEKQVTSYIKSRSSGVK